MTWRVAGIFLCALSMAGCNDDVEKPVSSQERRVVIDTPDGKVLIHNPVQNLEEQFVTADVEHDGVRYILRVAASSNSSGMTGGVTELLSESGGLLFSFETLIDDESGEVILTQRTPEDYLVHSMIADDERVREQYDANGDIATFEYPALSVDNQRRAANYHDSGLPGERLPGPVAEFVGELAAFDAYYEPHSKSTLHDNPAGELLAHILASPDTKTLVDGPVADRLRGIEVFCNTARACQSLMCWTNPSSLACLICTAVSIACTIMDIICSFIGC